MTGEAACCRLGIHRWCWGRPWLTRLQSCRPAWALETLHISRVVYIRWASFHVLQLTEARKARLLRAD